MKRCKRCYSIIDKNNSHCPSCGLEASLKNVYYTNENKKNSYNNSYQHNNKNNGKAILVFFIFFYAIAFIIGIIASIEEKEESKVKPSYRFDVNSINDYLYNTYIMADDYYRIWTLSLTSEITLNKIVDNTSLTYHNLNNNYCKEIDVNPTIYNSLNCVKTSYIDNGTHKEAFNDLESFNFILEEYEFTVKEYEILYDIYLNAVNLYNSTSEDKSYDKFEEIYNHSITEIEYLINELNNESL